MAETDTPFVWGAGGQQLTPGELAGRRKIAEAMMAQGMDSSPIKSPWQGVDRMAKAMLGAYQTRQTDEQEATARQGAIAQLMSALGGPSAAGSPVAAASPSGAVPAATPTTAPVAADASTAPSGVPAGKDAFVSTVMPIAQAASAKTGIDPRIIVAQAALETGWGRSAPGNNYFGIKSHGQPGGTVLPTSEVVNGQPVRTTDSFRAYASPEDSGAGYADFMNANPRYAGVKSAQGLDAQVNALGQSGYATDPAYGAKVGAIARSLPMPAAPGAPATAPSAAPPGPAAAPAAPSASAPARPGVAALMSAMSNPFLPPSMAAIAATQLKPHEMHNQVTDADGNIWDVNQTTGQRTVALQRQAAYGKPYRDDDGNLVQRDNAGKISVVSAADKTPNSVNEYKYYTDNFKPSADQQAPMDYATWSTAKARAAATNITNNVDMNSSQSYDKQLAEGLGKVHAGLATGVEDAQTRARDISAMQGAIDAIQKNGGTTGGLAPEQTLRLQKTINSGAAALGLDKVFDEKDLSDKEFMTKFNRSMAGAAAKGAVGNRVTNFEMSNYLKANPGLDMSITGNQRLLGIQAQIEQRNIAVGNAIREATARAISQGKKIDPVTVQKIITDYDEKNHVSDPVTGQDLTQSYTLPEFQSRGTNPSLAVDHSVNIDGITVKRIK